MVSWTRSPFHNGLYFSSQGYEHIDFRLGYLAQAILAALGKNLCELTIIKLSRTGCKSISVDAIVT